MANAGFEPAPFQTSALNWRLRPLGQLITSYYSTFFIHPHTILIYIMYSTLTNTSQNLPIWIQVSHNYHKYIWQHIPFATLHILLLYHRYVYVSYVKMPSLSRLVLWLLQAKWENISTASGQYRRASRADWGHYVAQKPPQQPSNTPKAVFFVAVKHLKGQNCSC